MSQHVALLELHYEDPDGKYIKREVHVNALSALRRIERAKLESNPEDEFVSYHINYTDVKTEPEVT